VKNEQLAAIITALPICSEAVAGNDGVSSKHRTSGASAPPKGKGDQIMSSTVVHTIEVAQEYLAAWKRKDADAIARLVHPDVRLKSPIAGLSGREPFLMMCRKIFPMLEGVIVRAAFSSETQAMLVYDFVLKEPIGVTRTANLMTFEGDLIRSVELFFDARPFEKTTDKSGI
jgi:hypothetical protein